MRRAILVTLASLALSTSQSCSNTDNPDYCGTDQDCRNTGRANFNPALDQCHGFFNFCYPGCATNADCQDTTKRWYRAGYTKCDPQTKDCVQENVPDGGTLDGKQTLPLGKPCTQNSQCRSNICTDHVCCDTLCTETCKDCDVAGSLGTCTFVPADTTPNNDCPGDPACGDGTCDANHQCIYPSTKPCGTPSCTGNILSSSNCGAKHECIKNTDAPCPGQLTCTSDTKSCKPGCLAHSDCVTGAYCNLKNAHEKGYGTCVPANETVVVSPSGATKTIAEGISKVLADAKLATVVVSYSATAYNENIQLGDKVTKAISIIGVPDASNKLPSITPPLDTKPVIAIDSNANKGLIHLQMLNIKNSTLAQVACTGALGANNPLLSITDSVIGSSAGLGISVTNCNAALYRNTIASNTQGGAKLSDGSFQLAENILAKNGAGNQGNVGGVSINSPQPATEFVFRNNTIVSNGASGTEGGVTCAQTMTLQNTLVWANTSSDAAAKQVSTKCQPTSSYVQGVQTTLPGFVNAAEGDYHLQPGSLCIDHGSQTPSAPISAIDRDRSPRVLGTAVDIGAYEK